MASVEQAPVNQSLIFQKLRYQLLRNSVATVFSTSPVRVITILLCSLLIWIAVFGASAAGFHYLRIQNIPFAGGIVSTLFDLLFLSLGVMLIFSTCIILFSSLFSAPETRFLLSLPASADQVFAYRFQGAIGFSSYAFVLLGSPVLFGYGCMYGVPWYFYLAIPLFFVGYLLIPGSVGALACLAIVNYFPRRRIQFLVGVGVLLFIGLIFWLVRAAQAARAHGTEYQDALRELFGHLAVARNNMLPSHWISQGLLSAARHDVRSAAWQLALLWSNGLFVYLLAALGARFIYRPGFNRISTGDSLRRRYGGHGFDALLERCIPFLHPQSRLLIIKDFRNFRRDPAQWGQILIFAGLLTFYTVSTRRYYTERLGVVYQSGISFMNLTATAFLLCAYTGRFIYPMLSLEGRKFWILGLLPLERSRLLIGKFGFSAVGALLIAEALVLSGDMLLGRSALMIGLHMLVIAVLAIGLSGLSVGLGACMPNFRESDPSKIAVGFGGTLNLVLGLAFVIAVLGFMAFPAHLADALGDPISLRILRWITPAGVILGLVVGVLAVVIPLRAGSRALEKMEF